MPPLQGTADTSSPNPDLPIVDLRASRSSKFRAASYQTAPLGHYDPRWREIATELYAYVQARVGRSRTTAYKGSFSVLSRDSSYTAAKIIIYQNGLGKPNGDWPELSDGTYVLLRADRGTGELDDGGLIDPSLTLGIAPKREERFYYFRVANRGLEHAARVIANWVG